jgi:hypothetical protein
MHALCVFYCFRNVILKMIGHESYNFLFMKIQNEKFAGKLFYQCSMCIEEISGKFFASYTLILEKKEDKFHFLIEFHYV